jgi:hypothetical protein
MADLRIQCAGLKLESPIVKALLFEEGTANEKRTLDYFPN